MIEADDDIQEIFTLLDGPSGKFIFGFLLFCAQLYIASKLSPIKKDIEFLRKQREEDHKSVQDLFDRCFENHKEKG